MSRFVRAVALGSVNATAIAGATIVLATASAAATTIVSPTPPTAAATIAPPTTSAAATIGAKTSAANAASPTPLPKGDARRGEALYARCAACHSLESDRTGPRHCGLFGRRAGSVTGFEYSSAMKRAGVIWETTTLDRFLADPLRVIPGTTMTYAGVADAQERADLIAYLRGATTRCGQRGVR